MGFITWLCVRVTSLLSFDIVIDLNIKNYISIMNLSRARSSFLFDIGILNFDILVYNHETKCCVHY